MSRTCRLTPLSELHALLVTPLSGPLSRFGRAGAEALAIWAEAAAVLPPAWQRVQLTLCDAHPDAATAMRRGLASRPDLVFGPYGSGPALRALEGTEHAVWNHGGASSRLRWPEHPNCINTLAPATRYFRGALEAVRRADTSARSIALLHVRTGFGDDVARGAIADAERLGFHVTTTGFEKGEGARAARGVTAADVLLVAAGFEDEQAAAPVLLQHAWRAAAFVGAGVEEVLRALGDRREGLLGPAQWIAAAAPRPNEGPDAAWFAERYRARTGSQPPYPAVQAFAAGVLAARCLREAGSADGAAQLAAARALECTTLFGKFRLDPDAGFQVGHEVLTVQWQDGARRVVWPPDRAERSLVVPR